MFRWPWSTDLGILTIVSPILGRNKSSKDPAQAKEASSRIKINRLLEQAGWRFFDDENGRANIQLEPSVEVTKQALDDLGGNFEKTSRGFVDFLLLNEKGFPIIVLEAKAEGLNPLVGKEQARKYARSQNCRFVILSNGNLHYFWDLERGNPYIITSFPTPSSVLGYQKAAPDPQKLVAEIEAEQALVAANRELIARMEKKIQATLARVWGDTPTV